MKKTHSETEREIVLKRETLTPFEAAARNGGVLKRDSDGLWCGAAPENKLLLPPRYSAETIFALVKDGHATYTQFKPGTRAATEVRLDLRDVYANYKMT